ncbi:excinuclease ABC subunit C [Inquilinus limosus]|uniref:UvrABC system protein C n=2 Tax=Inquilinus limosus TaxID=171674 RepID=A0A211ZSG8_9PROT|nr:excinuclease ABC subunit UvrC [Inquilinus limosus]OWJ68213.1 excinuclease ABC subunit C [Inquilinus limosus]
MSDTLTDMPPDAPPPERPKPSGRARTRAHSIADGVAVIQAHLRTLPSSPGVYRMLDEDGNALYVGKARNLKKRVFAYTQTGKQPARLLRMIADTVAMEFVVTRSEVEALLLEANLIKRLKPRYNVVMRDDKTFPHIMISGDHAFPRIAKHRGATGASGQFFGPFASAGSVNRTITALQRAFLLRNCSDSIFSTRSRPCLQYQIKRCTAPCVGYVTEAQYAEQVASAVDFLSGRSQGVQARFAEQMMAASEKLDFEQAARWRDRIRALTNVQSHQDINVEGIGDADALAIHEAGGHSCIQVYFFRGGRNYGTRAYFPSHDKTAERPEILAAFLSQFYDSHPPPPLVLLSDEVAEETLLSEALTLKADRKVEIAVPKRGDKRRLIEHALNNAREALGRRMAESASQAVLLEGVARVFGLDAPPRRIEVYDNSHLGGTNALGAMIVAGPDGFIKSAYRKFNIKGPVTPGDDYAMMREVLTRRFARALKEDPDREQEGWPDLVLIDGGQGQLSVVREVFAELGITDVALVSIAKGPDRDAGRERFFMADRPPFGLEPKDPVLYFLQRLRDEAHRFVIGGQRTRRAGDITKSPIDEIAGIGPRRKKALLLHFGSARAVSRASLQDLEAVDGISKAVAGLIYRHFHPDA